MFLDFALLLFGGLCLYYGAEWLITGAAGIARRLGVAPLVIGLTVVSYGTSAPELAVSLLAATRGQSAIALGNVVGSNIANIGLILGLTALLAPPRVDGMLIRRELPFLLIATLCVGPVLLDGSIDRIEGLALVAGAFAFTYATFRWTKNRAVAGPEEPDESQEILEAAADKSSFMLWAFLLIGLGVLVGGGHSFVVGAVGIAQVLGVSERVVGLTVVAFGTSLPELAASVMAAYRGHSDLAVGNVVGSNLFNILLILGLTSSLTPITGTIAEVGYDLAFMTLLTVLMLVSMRGARTITRVEGGLYCLSYVGFVVGLVALG
jgi:cation:H+ antiporter